MPIKRLIRNQPDLIGRGRWFQQIRVKFHFPPQHMKVCPLLNEFNIEYDPHSLWRCKHTFCLWPYCDNTEHINTGTSNELLYTRLPFRFAARCVRVTQLCSSEIRGVPPSAAIATNCSVSSVEMLHFLSLYTVDHCWNSSRTCTFWCWPESHDFFATCSS